MAGSEYPLFLIWVGKITYPAVSWIDCYFKFIFCILITQGKNFVLVQISAYLSRFHSSTCHIYKKNIQYSIFRKFFPKYKQKELFWEHWCTNFKSLPSVAEIWSFSTCFALVSWCEDLLVEKFSPKTMNFAKLIFEIRSSIANFTFFSFFFSERYNYKTVQTKDTSLFYKN